MKFAEVVKKIFNENYRSRKANISLLNGYIMKKKRYKKDAETILADEDIMKDDTKLDKAVIALITKINKESSQYGGFTGR